MLNFSLIVNINFFIQVFVDLINLLIYIFPFSLRVCLYEAFAVLLNRILRSMKIDVGMDLLHSTSALNKICFITQ